MFSAGDLDDFLPAWALWGQLLLVPAFTFIVSYFPLRLAAAIAIGPRPLPDAAHWPERARHAHQVRAATGWMFPAVVFLLAIGVISFENPLTKTSFMARVAVGLPFYLLSLTMIRSWRRRKFGQRRDNFFSEWNEILVNGVLFGWLYYVIAIVAAPLMPWSYSATTWFTLSVFFAIAIAARWDGDIWLLRRLGCLRPASPRLLFVVTAAGPREMPAVYETRASDANAFAVIGGSKSVVFTTRLLEICDDPELTSVAAHEIAHLDDPNMRRLFTVYWLRVAAVLAGLQIRPARGTWGTAAGLAMLAAAGVFVVLSQTISKRTRAAAETHADRKAIENVDGVVYSRALENIYRDSLLPVSKKSELGHPALYERMLASGAQPTYQRPRHPSRWRVIMAVVVSSFVSFCLVFGFFVAGRIVQSATREPETALRCMALTGGSAHGLARIAKDLAKEGKVEFALAVANRAIEDSPASPKVWYEAGHALAQLGKHEDARAAFAKSRELRKDAELADETAP